MLMSDSESAERLFVRPIGVYHDTTQLSCRRPLLRYRTVSTLDPSTSICTISWMVHSCLSCFVTRSDIRTVSKMYEQVKRHGCYPPYSKNFGGGLALTVGSCWLRYLTPQSLNACKEDRKNKRCALRHITHGKSVRHCLWEYVGVLVSVFVFIFPILKWMNASRLLLLRMFAPEPMLLGLLSSPLPTSSWKHLPLTYFNLPRGRLVKGIVRSLEVGHRKIQYNTYQEKLWVSSHIRLSIITQQVWSSNAKHHIDSKGTLYLELRDLIQSLFDFLDTTWANIICTSHLPCGHLILIPLFARVLGQILLGDLQLWTDHAPRLAWSHWAYISSTFLSHSGLRMLS